MTLFLTSLVTLIILSYTVKDRRQVQLSSEFWFAGDACIIRQLLTQRKHKMAIRKEKWATMKVGRGSFHMRGCSIVGNLTLHDMNFALRHDVTSAPRVLP